MKNHFKILLVTFLLVLNTQASVSYATVTDKSGLKLVGEGVMSVLFWDVYLARYYTPSGVYQNSLAPLALEFNYMMDIEAADLIDETINQWRELDLEEHPDEKQWAEQLYSIWPDVADGDQLIFRIDERLHSRFYYNQEWVGTIESKDFSERFAAIWLSEKTTAPKVRKKLLGQ